MATPVGAEHRDLEQRFRTLERGQSELVSATLRRQPIQPESVQVDVGTMASTTDNVWTQQPYTDIPVPAGYTRAVVQTFCATGVTLTAGGWAGVQPIVSTNGVATVGPAITSGVPSPGGPLSVTSAANISLSNIGPTVRIGVTIHRNGAITAGSQNYHISALILFLR